MNIFENLRMAFGSIASNKMRSLLTMLGIIIGISAVITITTLGTTLRSTIKSAMSSLGSNIFYIMTEPKQYNQGDQLYMTDEDELNMDMVIEYMEKYPDEVSPGMSNYVSEAKTINAENQYIKLNINGIFDGYLQSNNIKMKAGRRISVRDNEEVKFTAIVSDIFVNQYFTKKEEPIGKTIPITLDDGRQYDFTIVGVYKYSELSQGSFSAGTKEIDKQTPVFIPYMTSKKIQNSFDNTLGYIILVWNTKMEHDQILFHVQTFFEEKYASNKTWGVYLDDVQAEFDIIDTVINIITIVVSVIAAISLVVGGVGVMNIMLVSVTERTREIGIRKALGAKKRSIKQQFVTEAIIICLIGGIIGILVGIMNSELVGVAANYAVNMFPEYEDVLGHINIVPSTGAIIISLVFSTLTGVFFGIYPAGKAAKMNPIDALRYD